MGAERQERLPAVLSQALEPLAVAAVQALTADAAAVRLLDADGRLNLAAGHIVHSTVPLLPSERDLIPVSESRLDQEALAAGVAAVEDASADPCRAGLPPGFSAALCVILGPPQQPLGTLSVYGRCPRQFNPSETALLQATARLGAAAIPAAQRLADLEQVEMGRSQLMRVTAHELRSPITVAQSLLRNVLKGYAGPLTDQQRDVFARIAGQLDFLGNLVNDFLELTASRGRAAGADEGPVVVNVSLGRAVLLLQPRAEEKGVILLLRPAQEELAVWATEEDLDRVFVNLVDNAVKYTAAGGEVVVSLRRVGEEAQITVADTGIGIPEEALSHLFEEFYRAPNARALNAVGTGLGLAIVKGLVERSRGKVAVESKMGQGTTFVVTLPLYRPINSHRPRI